MGLNLCSQIYGYAQNQSENNLTYLQQIIFCPFMGVQPLVQIRGFNMHFLSPLRISRYPTLLSP